MDPRYGDQNPWQRPEPPRPEEQRPDAEAADPQSPATGAHPGQPPSMFQPPSQYAQPAQYGQASPYGQSDDPNRVQGGPPSPPQYGQPSYRPPSAPQYGPPPYGQSNYGSQPYQPQQYANPSPQQYGSPQDGSPQYGSPQYGQGNPQYGTQQYGTQQYGTQQYGTQQYGTQQYGTQQYGQGNPQYGMYQPSPTPRRKVNKKVIGLAAALVAVVVVVAGIAYAATRLGSHKLSHSAVEKTIETQSTDTSKSFRTITDVNCNDGKDIAVKKDASFTCTAAGNVRITVVIKSAARNPDWVWAIN